MVDGRLLLPEILGQLAPDGAKLPIIKPIIACSASAVIPSIKSSSNTNRKKFLCVQTVSNKVVRHSLA